MTRYEFDRQPSESERLAVCEWLESHGINPHDVVVPGFIETRREARQVAYRGRVWETTADGGSQIKLNAARDDVETIDRVIQLESPPMPFPLGSFA